MAGQNTEEMPTVEEVCSSFGLNDVAIEWSDADFANFTTFKLFQQSIRPVVAKENPKVGAADIFSVIIIDRFELLSSNLNRFFKMPCMSLKLF